MARFASITMSMRDIDRLKVIQAIIYGDLMASRRPGDAASARLMDWHAVTARMVHRAAALNL